MKYGFDTDSSGSAVCGVRQCNELNLTAGYLLFVFGTQPPEYSVCPDCHARSLVLAESLLQEKFETLAQSDGCKDAKFAAASITDALQTCNKQIYDLAAYIGQGIALGGAVIFVMDDTCIAMSFGGARMHFWTGSELHPHGEPPAANGLIADAIGTRQVWKGKFIRGKLQPGQRFICTSDLLPNLQQASQSVAEANGSAGHDNTVAMVLRKELEQKNIPPTAVLDIGNWE